MKTKLFLILAGLALFAASTPAQSNCSSIIYALTAHTKTYDPEQPYIGTETYSYAVTCINQAKGNIVYYKGSDGASATGGWFYNGTNNTPCDPTWEVRDGLGVPGKSANWFTVSGQSYWRLAPQTGRACVTGAQQVNTVFCSAIACPAPKGGGCQTNCGNTPIVIDQQGTGYCLTGVEEGVKFDFSGSGDPVQTAWTAASGNNSFLVLPGPDGLVHSGKDLFGNYSPQPVSRDPNGFAALAIYDAPENGGNGDGVIDAHDGIWTHLRLWIDANHDGVCQRDELFTLPAMGVNSFSLQYTEGWKTDAFGNIFRYKGRINPEHKDRVDSTIYDVIFKGLP